jgi:hypothetical protein
MIIFYILLFTVIFLAPAYLARLNGKGKMDMGVVRISSWLFGWTIVGWFVGLYWAIK